jgi:hypothetical protein
MLTKELMERTIRDYFDACNTGSSESVQEFFTKESTHYFPEGSQFGVLRGSSAIGDCWARCVAEFGSFWTVDNFVGDPETGKAVIEWTHFKKKINHVLRGDEWYQFAPNGKILEIKAYYASPTHPGIVEHKIGGFDYQGRGYSIY